MKSALITAGVTAGGAGEASGAVPQVEAAPGGERQFYELRTYYLRNGPQTALVQEYMERALIPALNRRKVGPVGAFGLDIGPETPTYYVLIPGDSAEALLGLDGELAGDAEYVRAAEAFLRAPASAPAYLRSQRTILQAFAGWPKLQVPKGERRVFQLRTYESAGEAAHLSKVRMFDEAEIGLFTKHGLNPVIFGQTVAGTPMPSLTYLLAFPSLAELTARWSAFVSDPAWRELSHRPGNTDAEIVSNISNLYLSPLRCSQI